MYLYKWESWNVTGLSRVITAYRYDHELVHTSTPFDKISPIENNHAYRYAKPTNTGTQFVSTNFETLSLYVPVCLLKTKYQYARHQKNNEPNTANLSITILENVVKFMTFFNKVVRKPIINVINSCIFILNLCKTCLRHNDPPR